jgi:hypothetical protein
MITEVRMPELLGAAWGVRVAGELVEREQCEQRAAKLEDNEVVRVQHDLPAQAHRFGTATPTRRSGLPLMRITSIDHLGSYAQRATTSSICCSTFSRVLTNSSSTWCSVSSTSHTAIVSDSAMAPDPTTMTRAAPAEICPA